MPKDIIMHKWTGTEYEQLHPLTKASNVLDEHGKSVQEQMDDDSIHVTRTKKAELDSKETTIGAQTKADQAEQNAMSYTDQEVGIVDDKIGILSDELDAHADTVATNSVRGHIRL